MKNNLNFCFASNDWYAEHLLVAIYSLIYNLNKNYIANVFILDGWITSENISKIKNIENKFWNIKIEFIQITDKKYNNFPSLHLSKEMYFRIWIPEILINVNKILYLDCDIIINWDISSIFDYNIDKCAIWAPNDIWTFFHYKEILNIPSQYEYFNSWVLLMNLEYFRKHKISEKIFDYIWNHKLITWDQDAINAILWDKRLVLELKYDALDWVFIWNKNKQFTNKEINQARNNPVVIHYAWSKPWKKYCTHPLKNKYHEYRKLANLEKITYSKRFEFNLFLKNFIWLVWIYLINIIPRKYYYYIIFKPKKILTHLLK